MTVRRAFVALLALGISGSAGTTLTGATFSAASTNPGNRLTAAADWVAPAVTATAPTAILRATVTLSATATDASPIVSVRLQRSPAGAADWTDVCTDATSPYSCAFDTTAVADGRYDFRAIALDDAANTGTSAIVANRLVDNNPPTVAIDDLAADVRATITITATAADGAGSGVVSVRFQRSPAAANTWTDICTRASAPYSCTLDTTALANDDLDLRAIATDAAGNASTSAIETIAVDNALPTVSLGNPGSPLAGTVSLTATAADADSGIATVTIQRAPAGTATWTDICTSTAAPWSCSWTTTTVVDGLYDLRAIAVDAAGNSRTSAVVSNRRVDNTISSVSLDDPGSPLRATVTLRANANSSGGVAAVAIQRAPAGAATWTTVCSAPSAPYSCSLNTAAGATPDGSYDFRAIMTTTSGATLTSATVASRTIDNAVVSGTDIQAANKTGGKLGRMESGDVITLTYSSAMKPSTLIAGWTGAGAASLFVRATDASQVETTRFTTDSAGNTATGLGSFVTGGNFVRTNRAVAFAASATLSTGAGGGSVVTITLGAVSVGSGNERTQSSATTLKWTPSATATDVSGIASSTSVVTESGAADRDF